MSKGGRLALDEQTTYAIEPPLDADGAPPAEPPTLRIAPQDRPELRLRAADGVGDARKELAGWAADMRGPDVREPLQELAAQETALAAEQASLQLELASKPDEELEQIRKIKETLQNAVADKPRAEVGPDLTCKVCYERQCDVVLSPCGHLCACAECVQQLPRPRTCPTCRRRVASTVKMFIS